MITDTYIKMCEMAIEMQSSGWENNKENKYIKNTKGIRSLTYLPTLEQLFEMVGDYRKQIDRPFLSLMIMKKYKYKSMHELILCTVMEIKYKKAWTGEKWEAIK